MNKKEQDLWDKAENNWKNYDYIGIHLRGESFIPIPSFKRLWLEYLYQKDSHRTYAFDYMKRTISFWDSQPKTSNY